MAKRMPKPFFRDDRKRWYVQVGGKQINLGPDEDEANKQYFKIMAGKAEITEDSSVGILIEQFLASTKALKPKSYRSLAYRLNTFWEFLQKEYGFIKISKLKAIHWTKFLEWLAVQPARPRSDKRSQLLPPDAKRFNPNSIHAVCVGVQQCFKWGVNNEVIARNPFAGMPIPPSTAREVLVTDEQFDLVLSYVPDENFRDLLVMLRETGARPFEICTVEASNFDREEHRLVFGVDGSKGKKYNRVIYLNEIAYGLVVKWVLRNPEGPIFRNTVGNPWRNATIHNRLCAISKKCGFKLMPYALRHTFATNSLQQGVESMTVAQLMGHRNTAMIAKVYGHLGKVPDYLKKSLEQATRREKLPPTGTDG